MECHKCEYSDLSDMCFWPDNNGPRPCEANKEESKMTNRPFAVELKDTVDDMLSGDYKTRFVAEYWQNKIRYEKLKNFCDKIEAADMMGWPIPQHDVPMHLLREQQGAMGQYLHVMEIRAIIEGIDLHLCIKSND